VTDAPTPPAEDSRVFGPGTASAPARRRYTGPPDFSMIDAVTRGFGRYVTFSGRATRAEYWYFGLASGLVGFSIDLATSLLIGAESDTSTLISLVANLLWLLPSLSVSARRLHDTGRSGWWWLIAFTGIGIIPLMVWSCTEGDSDDNAYGPPVTA